MSHDSIRKTSDKTYKLSSHVACTVAGLTADANILIDEARLRACRYMYQYGEPIPMENLVEHVCNYKQAYTQYGGLRPFGVAFLFAGYDTHYGFQLYQSDPSGNYSGWKATVIGSNHAAGKSLLKTEYGILPKDSATTTTTPSATEEKVAEEEDQMVLPTTDEALRLAVKVLNKTMDASATSAEKMELFYMTLSSDGQCVHKILSADETQKIIQEMESQSLPSGDM